MLIRSLPCGHKYLRYICTCHINKVVSKFYLVGIAFFLFFLFIHSLYSYFHSVIMITLSELTIAEKRAQFFNVGEPFTIPAREFDDELWPLISNIWVQFNVKSPAKGPWIVYTCCFTKPKESSSRKEEIS